MRQTTRKTIHDPSALCRTACAAAGPNALQGIEVPRSMQPTPLKRSCDSSSRRALSRVPRHGHGLNVDDEGMDTGLDYLWVWRRSYSHFVGSLAPTPRRQRGPRGVPAHVRQRLLYRENLPHEKGREREREHARGTNLSPLQLSVLPDKEQGFQR